MKFFQYSKAYDLLSDHQLCQVAPKSSSRSHISKSGTIDKAVSDHPPVYMIRKKPRERHENLATRGRSYTDYNKVNYQNTIRNDVCWIDFRKEGKNVNDLWQIMYTSIVNAADTQCPELNIRLKSVRPGWMTIDTIEALNDKYRLYKLAKSTKLEQDWVNYREARNYAARILKHAKEQFIIREIESCGDDTRKLWRELTKIWDPLNQIQNLSKP